MSSNRSKKLKIDPNAIRQQVSYSVSEEQNLENKISEISSLKVGPTANERSMEVYLVCQFGMRKMVKVSLMLSSASFLPENVAISKIICILETTEEVAKNVLIHLVNKKANSGFDTIVNKNEVKVVTPPTSTCLDCKKQLVLNHACKLTYNYSKWGNSNGWKMYPSPRTLVESSDCCFMERKVFNWMTSFGYGKII